MNKRFEHKKVPAGREVLEAQLVALLEKIKRIDPAETAKLDEYLPKINEVLGDMPREEIIKRFVLGDFNRFLSYYKNAAELNVHVTHGHRDERPPRGDRPDRGPRASSYDRHDPSLRRERPVHDPIEGGIVKLRVNIGKMNNLTVPDLIGLINRATPGPMLKLGHIRIMEQDSVFEVAQGAEEILIPNLSRAIYNERQIRCVQETDLSHGIGPRIRPSYHERRDRPGQFERKKKFHRGQGPR
jgi:ATP-dependent RNA helicase DeaD